MDKNLKVGSIIKVNDPTADANDVFVVVVITKDFAVVQKFENGKIKKNQAFTADLDKITILNVHNEFKLKQRVLIHNETLNYKVTKPFKATIVHKDWNSDFALVETTQEWVHWATQQVYISPVRTIVKLSNITLNLDLD